MVNPLEKCQHMLKKISDRKKCKYCKKIFGSARRKNYHIQQVHQAHLNLCSECGKSFASEKRLSEHERVSHSEAVQNKPKPKCEFCDKMFRIPSLLQNHIKQGI